MKSKKSAVEEQMNDMVILCNDIIDDSYLTTKDARKITDLLEKGLMKIQELRISRDNNATKCEELRKEKNNRVSTEKLKQLMIKSFKMGQKKYDAKDMPIRLWIRGVMDDLNIKKKKAKG